MKEALLAEALDARAHGGESGSETGEERSMHSNSINTVTIDIQFKMRSMKNKSTSIAAWKKQYNQLRKSLARIGYISQGSVLQRSTGLQWTRKVAQKTVTISLSQPQFLALGKAVKNERKLWKTIQLMERVSRQIIFASTPDIKRRKRLSRKVLGLI